jgi:UDP-N-acetylglucosamine--dolichyl-phosphate N-acetylglucosaminephosphotransferase
MGFADFIYATLTFALQRPMDVIPPVLAFLAALAVVLFTMPPLIRKMRDGGMVGHDVNKRGRPTVAELGGIASLFAFSISLSLVVGLEKLGPGGLEEPPYLAAISVFFIASMIGLIDDISNIKQRVKAVAVVFAALPLLLVHYKLGIVDGEFGGTFDVAGNALIALPFGGILDFRTVPLLYWLVLVPIGVTGVANAMNMSAGYNGLESGQIAVVGGSLLVVSVLRGTLESVLIFSALLGAALGLYWFNRHPAKVFVGDIGTLGLGAAIAAGAIIGGIEVWGLIAIAPAFYEAGATFYYGAVKRNGNRREACHNPRIARDGTLSPPKGAERYTLAYLLLSRRPMKEPRLVATLLALYALSGVAAIVLSLV